eukprot:CAMPEP_0170993954 /NCGR_PEP_ID=MMETSP0736-20130129/10659_1 /TAXON_ID=186038 /ORGANISM="Fragilariopsis kerguelensis, Strain L26-C5" /LENGTH=358 /DNA_ID=CAMNT_0011419727 /DNA_START=463 /DNA_END=1540 /DNA_ORIENTATION=+
MTPVLRTPPRNDNNNHGNNDDDTCTATVTTSCTTAGIAATSSSLLNEKTTRTKMKTKACENDDDTEHNNNNNNKGIVEVGRTSDDDANDNGISEIAELAHAELSELLERCHLHNNKNNNNNNNENNDGYSSSQQHYSDYRESFPMACRTLLHELDGNRYCLDCHDDVLATSTDQKSSSACNPEWAAISYGALVCIKCSGRHRSLGVAVSQVRSVAMDHWTYREVVSMLEGGNSQLSNFFGRHALTKSEFEKRQQKKKKLEQQQRNQQQQFVSNHHRTTSTIASTNTKATTTIKNITTSSTKSITMENVTELRYKTKAALFYKNQLEAHVGRLLAEDPTQNKLNGSDDDNPIKDDHDHD